MRLENERVFKYSIFIYHLILFYQSDNFPFPVLKLDTRENPRFVIFFSAAFHDSFETPYSYNELIDLFFHRATTLLTWISPPRISGDIKKTLQLSKQYKLGD